MAALAIPALEGALAALTALLARTAVVGAAGAGAVVLNDEIKRRQEATSQAATKEAAKTATQTRTKPCDKCPPDCGLLVARNWNMSAAAREYQARVTSFAPGSEWNYAGIDFDGFSSADCHLKEAKSRYDQFLTGGEDSELEPKTWFKAFKEKMLPQAEKQARAAAASPPARLTWFFQGSKTYQYMGQQVMLFPPLVAVLQP
jgi:Restriction endonuclease fold toxin 5